MLKPNPIDPEPIERVGIFPPRVWYTPRQSSRFAIREAALGRYTSAGHPIADSDTGAGAPTDPATPTDAGPYWGNDSYPDTEAHL